MTRNYHAPHSYTRRFASPFSADFSHLDACDHEGGASSTVAVTDQEGRVFVLDITSRLTS
jgi:hypothetical protein